MNPRLIALLLTPLASLHTAEPVTKSIGTKPLRILPLGDSITRGSYLALKDGEATGLPHPQSGGWRKALQDRLRAAGIAFDLVEPPPSHADR
jgi:lysophospholipase L1-like esterase